MGRAVATDKDVASAMEHIGHAVDAVRSAQKDLARFRSMARPSSSVNIKMLEDAQKKLGNGRSVLEGAAELLRYAAGGR